MMFPLHDIILLDIKKTQNCQVYPAYAQLKRVAQIQCQKLGADISKWEEYYSLDNYKSTTTYRTAFHH